MTGDCASDPPLGATARALAVRRAADVVYGLGVEALERGARTLKLAARHEDAAEALAGAIAQLRADVELVTLADAWPAAFGDEVVGAEVLVQAADRARGRAQKAYLTIAGAVAEPAVLAVDPTAPLERLLAEVGRPLVDDWVAVAGGAPAGRLVDRDTPAGELGALVVVLPASHEVVRRLQTPLADWLWRAASACEGCRQCSDACPPSLLGAPLAPHAAIWTMTTLRDDGVDLAQTLGCTGCGLCDVMCPASLSPRAIVTDLRDRFRRADRSGAAAAAHATGGAERAGAVAGLSLPLLTLRLGLAPFDRAPANRL